MRQAGPQHPDGDPDSATVGQTIRPVTVYAYDTLGNLTQVRAGKTTDLAGASVNPDSGVSSGDSLATQSSFVYDDFGRLLKETDGNGNP